MKEEVAKWEITKLKTSKKLSDCIWKKGNAAFMERITPFIFQNSIPDNERIINMDDLLFQERDLIVSWSMEGLQRLVQNNFTFSEAADAVLIRQSRNMPTNPRDDFLIENCLFKSNSKVFSVNLYSEYRIYCRDNALEELSQREFISEIIAKTEGSGVVHKKLRIGKSKPLLGFENMSLKKEFSGKRTNTGRSETEISRGYP